VGLRYVGRATLLVKGAVSGRVYALRPEGGRVDCDGRDAPAFLASRLFERWSPEWKKLRDSGKWKEAPDYGLAKTGRLVLQDHGSVFWFRNVKIRTIQ
jgi:hypothetical protein